jgi:hypothetical protein
MFQNNMNVNPQAYQAFINMINMNQNLNMRNSMNLNDYMMQYMMMNPFFFQMNNNIQYNNQNMQAFNLGNLNNQNLIQNGGLMPRKKNFNPNVNNIDSFPGYTGPRMNVVFETGTGIHINIACPNNISVKDLLIKFAERVGVSPLLIGKKIFCVVNGSTIRADEQTSVGDYFRDQISNQLKFQVKIIFLDASNVIGA